MLKFVRNLKKNIFLIFMIVVLSGILVYSLTCVFIAEKSGTRTGTEIGLVVGNVSGDIKAIADAEDFINQGEEQGIMARDTKISEITNTLRVTGKLRVLTADVSLDNFSEIGEKYKALYIMDGTVNFSVDLSKVNISFDKNAKTLDVIIPAPTADLNIDSGSVRKLSESKKFVLADENDKGSVAYINSMAKLKEDVHNSLENYDSLYSIAQKEAVIKIKELIGSLSFAEDIDVKFAGGEQ